MVTLTGQALRKYEELREAVTLAAEAMLRDMRIREQGNQWGTTPPPPARSVSPPARRVSPPATPAKRSYTSYWCYPSTPTNWSNCLPGRRELCPTCYIYQNSGGVSGWGEG